MTSSFQTNDSSPLEETGRLLRLIADDTRRQIHKWTALSLFLDSSSVLTPAAQHATLILAKDAMTVLRSMLACAKEAIRCFRKRRYDRCLRSLERFDGLHHTLEAIDQKAAHTILRSIFERGSYGRNH